MCYILLSLDQCGNVSWFTECSVVIQCVIYWFHWSSVVLCPGIAGAPAQGSVTLEEALAEEHCSFQELPGSQLHLKSTVDLAQLSEVRSSSHPDTLISVHV